MLKKINVSEYPPNLEWDDKVFSMPNIPRGDKDSIDVLKQILLLVRENESSSKKLIFAGSKSTISLEEACVRLRPMKLVIKSSNGWELPDTSIKWLESGDNLYLAAILCANVRFLSEILFYLDIPRTAAELQSIAVAEYDMNWKTTSALNIRLVWLRQLGLVDFQKFSLKYSLTKCGKNFIKTINVVNPSEIIREFDETINEQDLDVSEWAKEYCNKKKTKLRKPSIGYIPRNISEVKYTITDFLSIIRSGASYEDFRKYAKINYNIAFSSSKSFLTTLINLGFVSRRTDLIVEITDLAKDWLQETNNIDLILCVHVNYLFVLEVLKELENEPLSYKQLAAKAKVSYGFVKEDVQEIRKRIALFKAAKLVMNISADKYVITNRGRNLLNLFPDLQIAVDIKKHITTTPKSDYMESLFNELRLASKDSSNPSRLEKVVKLSMEAIGFKAEWLGGSGKTDVLLQAPGAPKFSFTVTVDTKSTASGSVSDSIVDFDTLKEHKKKHKADYIAIVGCSFQNERLIKRAIDHNVALIDIDILEELIEKHIEIPLMVSTYRKIFEQKGIVDVSALEEERNKIVRYGSLMKSVMECLLIESKDEITKGLLQERDLYRSLRDNDDFENGIELSEISAMLAFLSSPLVGCLGKEKDNYYAIGSLEDAAKKFDFYTRACSYVELDRGL